MNAVLRRETESKLEMAPPTVGRKVWLKLQNQDKVIRGVRRERRWAVARHRLRWQAREVQPQQPQVDLALISPW